MKKQFKEKKHIVFLILVIIFSFFYPVNNVYATAYNTNLIVNGDAETGDFTGWDVIDSGNLECGDPFNDFFLDNYSPNGGKVFDIASFWGVLEPSSLRQNIDISSLSADVDLGIVQFNFKSYILHFYNSDGYNVVRLETMDALDNVTATYELSNDTIDGDDSWQEKTANGLLPAGTRKLRITIEGGFTNYDHGDYMQFDGIELSLTYVATTPTVTTDGSIASITATGATVSGNVTNDGNLVVTERGIQYKRNGTGDSYSSVVASAGGTGVYTVDLVGLTSNTTYDVRAYATNAEGTSYGGVHSFTTVALSNNADLSALNLSSGTLDPVFDSGTTGYTASVGNEVSSITITPTVADATATVTVNGSAVTSGNPSGALNLDVGANTITVVVTAQDNTEKTYTINVTRGADTQATPTFDPPSGSVAFGTEVTITSAGADAIYYTTDGTEPATSVGGSTSLYTAPITIDSAVTIRAIAVKAGNIDSAVATASYTQAATANLTNIALSGNPANFAFAGGTYLYNGVTVANEVESITVTPTGAGTITVNGTPVTSGEASEAIALKAGQETEITVIATEIGKTSKTYKINVTREGAVLSSNADLSGLSLSAGTLDPVFDSGTTSYTASVANGVSSITVTPTVADAPATVTVNGSAVISGQASGAINLNVGANTITVVATAHDGTTTKTYTVTVTRAENPTYTVAYEGNGSNAGTVPLDSNSYEEGESVTVLGNTGNLEKIGYTFGGWNTQADGQGTSYSTGSTFTMGTENVTLYAKWIDSTSIRMTANPDNVKGNINFNQTFTLNLYNDTVTGFVYREDINLESVFSTLNISSVSNSSNTVTLAVYGSLNTQGIGTISLDQNKLKNSTTPLIAEVVVSLNTVTYHGNGNTGGSVPTDSNTYEDGATVTVLGNIGNLVRTGYTFAGWNTQANGQGTSYTQGSTLIMETTNVNLYAMWIKIPSGGGSSGGGTGGKKISTPATEREVVVIVNGEKQTVGKETVIEQGGEKIVELRVDRSVLSQRIDKVITINQAEGRQGQNLIEIPVSAQGVNEIRSVLTGDIVKKMEDNQFTLVISTEKVNYVIPAKEIAIEKVAAILNVAPKSLQQIEIELRIAYIDEKKANEITQRGRDQGIEVIMQPVEFQLVAKTTSNTGEGQETIVSQFSSYVSRVMGIPQGVDPSKVTTGIVYNADGTFAHIPTTVYMENGKWYAKLNSLTNSSYSVIWNPISVASVENHWSKKAVNDMASRLIIKNPKTFNPQGYITRGEFAEYITKALGIYRTGVAKVSNFTDVEVTNELADAIEAATEYGIIKGYPDGTFRPDAKISREEAMIMYANAMDIVGLNEIDNRRIENYKDKEEIADWAYEFVKKTVSIGVFNGRTIETISPKDTFTYAEAATAIRNLLVRADLIND